ncbi:hypothetical protein GGD50_005331 [Rhizobium paranaense]|uniref:Uncharacterized protein n=1 Tax=Rhizobium paranaense TaxID=1650438 RepID=A0A7W8XW93_9HYPH|nr:hypothetical protein [Rhizobium paranaense]
MTTRLRYIISKVRLPYAGRICSRLLIRTELPRRVSYSRSIRLSLALMMAPACLPAQSFAQSPAGPAMPDVEFGARKIFFMLFLMLGPIKILMPFVALTSNCDTRFRRRMANPSGLPWRAGGQRPRRNVQIRAHCLS